MPAEKSRKRLPSMSSMTQPSPRTGTSGYARGRLGEVTRWSSSTCARARGPGISVTSDGRHSSWAPGLGWRWVSIAGSRGSSEECIAIYAGWIPVESIGCGSARRRSWLRSRSWRSSSRSRCRSRGTRDAGRMLWARPDGHGRRAAGRLGAGHPAGDAAVDRAEHRSRLVDVDALRGPHPGVAARLGARRSSWTRWPPTCCCSCPSGWRSRCGVGACRCGGSTIVSAAFSVGIELTQGLAGNGRSADITDVLMNTLGGMCGWAPGPRVADRSAGRGVHVVRGSARRGDCISLADSISAEPGAPGWGCGWSGAPRRRWPG